MMKPSSNRIHQALCVLACLVFSVGLFSYALIGTTSRYLQDDFCYAGFLRGAGNFFYAQYYSYMVQTTFSANRFSLTLGMALSELAGPINVRILPGLMLLAWVFGLYVLIRRIADQNPWVRLSRLEAFLAAEALALFTLTTAPNWIQVFFWRPGMFPYFAPLVTGTYLILLVLIAAQADRWRPLLWLCIFLLAVLTGGFSETAVCVELVLLGILFGISLLFRGLQQRLALPTGTALLGSAVAMALLIASPMNARRLAISYGSTASLPEAMLNTLKGGVYFYAAAAYRPTLLYASALVFFGLLGLLHTLRAEKPPLSWKRWIIALAVAILIAYLLTSAALAPSFYVESSYPGKRALIVPGFVSILLMAVVGFLTGSFVSRWLQDRRFALVPVLAGVAVVAINALWLSGITDHFYPPAYPDMRTFLRANIAPAVLLAAASLLLFGLLFYRYKTQGTLALVLLLYLIQPGLMAARILDEYPILRNRAALWDTRQSQILAARDSGQKDQTVRALDSLAGLSDLSKKKDYWVNICAADYYQLNSIRAIEPVLDPERLVNP